jgi:hypothetical protein
MSDRGDRHVLGWAGLKKQAFAGRCQRDVFKAAALDKATLHFITLDPMDWGFSGWSLPLMFWVRYGEGRPAPLLPGGLLDGGTLTLTSRLESSMVYDKAMKFLKSMVCYDSHDSIQGEIRQPALIQMSQRLAGPF